MFDYWRVASWWFFTTPWKICDVNSYLIIGDGICFKRDTVDPYLLVNCICYYMNPYLHMYLYIYTYIYILYNITACNSYSFVLYQNYAHKIFGLCHLFVGWNYVKFPHANIISYHIISQLDPGTPLQNSLFWLAAKGWLLVLCKHPIVLATIEQSRQQTAETANVHIKTAILGTPRWAAFILV